MPETHSAGLDLEIRGERYYNYLRIFFFLFFGAGTGLGIATGGVSSVQLPIYLAGCSSFVITYGVSTLLLARGLFRSQAKY
ncbi:MAG: hypothetical protein RIF32_04470, partial [Leptospirales bacterium]